jgi:uncharacterized protein
MKKISNLQELLKNPKPALYKGKFYLASLGQGGLFSLVSYINSINCIFREEEGLSILFSEGIKEEISGMTEDISGPFALITLEVNSDLLAVGFPAKITEALAKEKISVNAYSAFHHNHLLVPYEQKEKALLVLKSLAK